MKHSCVTSFDSVYLQERRGRGGCVLGSEIQKKKAHRKDAGDEHSPLHNAVPKSTAMLGKHSGHYVAVPSKIKYIIQLGYQKYHSPQKQNTHSSDVPHHIKQKV